MFKYDLKQLNKLSNENNFITNTIEKVLRLIDILNFINQSEIKDCLALKGGTAINLFIFNLPRLSIDIDLDFIKNNSMEEIIEQRNKIKKIITGFMFDNGYILSNRSKNTHTLDSYVFSYKTLSGSNDALKIEINYSNRVHIFDPIEIETEQLGCHVKTICLDFNELIGSKISALVSRTTPRDMYDVYNLFKENKISNLDLIRKIVIFYLSLGNDVPIDINGIIETCKGKIKRVNYNILRETLIPVIHKSEKVNIDDLKHYLNDIISNLFLFDSNDLKFISNFNRGIFSPELLFNENKLNNLKNHPMALWKMKKLNDQNI